MNVQEYFAGIYIDMTLYIIFLIYIMLNFTFDPLKILALMVVFSSLALWIASKVQLGKSFSVKPAASTLVTSGIYSKIRNPIYLFTFIANIGIIYLLDNKYLYLLIPAIIGIQLYRVRQEEKILFEKFGNEYADYKKTTWF